MLGLIDLNIALLKLKPDASDGASFASLVVKFEKWKMINILSLMHIKWSL